MKILILGGTGAMGAYLVDIMAELGHMVYVTSRGIHVSDRDNVHYVQGNALDFAFITNLLSESFDAIIDFMIYTNSAFESRAELLLKATKQYFYLSSSRVYADSVIPITEKASRLLDVCDDSAYLATNEYALDKARQENILRESGCNNWVVIRPYITYSEERLQLGVYEKESWLHRALQGKTIVFSRDIAEKYTSLTSGYDVAMGISKLVGNEKTVGEVIQIVNPNPLRWEDVFNVYLDVLEEKTNNRPKVYYLNDMKKLVGILHNEYQLKYDRLLNRVFNSEKVDQLLGVRLEYVSVSEGLRKCIEAFIDEKRSFKGVSWGFEAYMDRITGEKTSLKEIAAWKDKLKYLVGRYTPYFEMRL